MSKYFLLSLAFLLAILSGCDKTSIERDYPLNPEPPVTNQPSPISTRQTEAGIQGIIVDENNDPVQGAMVTCGDGRAVTNAAGAFLIANAKMTEAAAVVKVNKPGYFSGNRTIVITGKNQIQFVQIMLLPKKVAGAFDAGKGGVVTASNARFTFGPGMVLDSKNQPYTGTVSLIYAPINPEHPEFGKMLPGDLRGVNNKNEEVGLQSFGMMAVELQSETGEALHLNGLKEVEIKMTIPASLQATAPGTIPLWHFDEKDGLWKEEGSATKSGDSYIGKVKHFSFWNCDAQFPVVNFKVALKDQFGAPLANSQVLITRPNGSTGYGNTDINGMVSGMIPTNETLTLSVKNRCGQEFQGQAVGPFTRDTDAGALTINIPVNDLTNISGTVNTCAGTAVNNGVVVVTLDSIRYAGTIKDGKYKLSILRCQQGDVIANVIVTDLDNSKQAASDIVVSTGSYNVNLSACDEVQFSSISVNLSGTTYSLNSIADSATLSSYNDIHSFSFSRKSGYADDIFWQINSLDAGAHTPITQSIRLNNRYYRSDITVTITQTANPGQYLSGTISGTVDDSTTVPSSKLPINGTFKIQRRQ